MPLKLDSTTEQMLVECARSTKVMAQVFFPHHFWRGFSPQHELMFELLDAPPEKVQRKLLIAHRGFGKTTCIQLAFAARKILFGDTNFLTTISCSNTLATRHSETLKGELSSNELVKQLWGTLEGKDDFSKEFWVCRMPNDKPVAVMPRGAGQQIRGSKYMQYRPSTLIFDDLEDTESVRNPNLRYNTAEWFETDALKSVDLSLPWEAVVAGTILHEDSLLEKLRKSGDWEVVSLPVCDDNYKTSWPEYMSQEALDAEVDRFRKNGELDLFAREFMNRAIAKETQTFKSDYFHYYEEPIKDKIENYVIVDAAKTSSKTADDSAIVGIGVSTVSERLWVRDVVADRLHIDKVIDEALGMCQRLNARILGVEVTGLNEWITFPFQNAILQRRLPIQLVALHAKGKKEDRIISLLPFYRTGMILHNMRVTAKLEGQLTMFPRSAKDDVMDALAHGVQLMDIGGRYMAFSHSADEQNQELIESEYSDLMDNEYDAIVENPLYV